MALSIFVLAVADLVFLPMHSDGIPLPHLRTKYLGQEKKLRGSQRVLLLQRTQVQLLVPTSAGSQPLITLAPGGLTPSSDLTGSCSHVWCTNIPQMHTHTHKEKRKLYL